MLYECVKCLYMCLSVCISVYFCEFCFGATCSVAQGLFLTLCPGIPLGSTQGLYSALGMEMDLSTCKRSTLSPFLSPQPYGEPVRASFKGSAARGDLPMGAADVVIWHGAGWLSWGPDGQCYHASPIVHESFPTA